MLATGFSVVSEVYTMITKKMAYQRDDLIMGPVVSTTYARCDVKNDKGECLNIVNPGPTCTELYQHVDLKYDNPFYYNIKLENAKCPDGNETCTLYSNTLTGDLLWADEEDRIVRMIEDGFDGNLIWTDDVVTVDMFEVTHCNGQKLPKPVDICSNSSYSDSDSSTAPSGSDGSSLTKVSFVAVLLVVLAALL